MLIQIKKIIKLTFMKKLSLEELILFPNMLALKWKGNKEAYLNYPTLRLACPCAFCSGEVDALGNKYGGTSPSPSEDISVIKYQLVGHYGVRLYFSDGHSDGIYTFDLLNKLSFAND